MKYTFIDYLKLALKIKPKWTIISYFDNPIVEELPELGRPLPTDYNFLFKFSAKSYARDLESIWKSRETRFRYRVVRISEWNAVNSEAETP